MPDITDYRPYRFARYRGASGLGVMFPVGNATIIAFFDGERRSRLLGLGITIQFLFNLDVHDGCGLSSPRSGGTTRSSRT